MTKTDQLMTFDRAAQTLPEVNGKKPSSATVYRWAIHGIAGVRLQSKKFGGRRVTTPEALAQFLQRVEEAST